MAGLPTVATIRGDRAVATALDIGDPAISDDIKEIITSASARWLKNEEVLAILESFQLDAIVWPKEAAERPDGGKLFLFNRKLCRGFRSDKHNWRKKNDGRTVKETHEKLKVGDRERLNCYYAHAEDSDGLQRRCYWILETPKDDVVMVHYLRSSTSRVGPRGGGSSAAPSRAAAGAGAGAAGAGGAGGAGPSRPQRAAAQRARYKRYGDFALDSDEEDGGDGGGDDAAPPPPRAPAPVLEPVPLQGIPVSVAALPVVSHPGLMASPPAPAPPAAAVGAAGAPPLDLSLSLGEGMESIDFGAALGRLDSKLDSMADIPWIKKIPEGTYFVDNPKALPSLADQDAAARNAGRVPLGNYLHTAAGAAAPAGAAAAAPRPPPPQGAPSPGPRRLVHDPLGSGDGTVLLPDMSLAIAHTQDSGAAELAGLFPSTTVDTTGMFHLADGRRSSGSAGGGASGGGGGQPGSPDSKAPRAPLPPFALGGGRGGAVVTSGVAVPSLGSGDFEAALPPGLKAGAGAAGPGGPGLQRNDSSFGATEMEASGEAPGEGSGKERGAAAAAAVAAADAADAGAEPRRGLYHQESSVADKMAAADAAEAQPPKVETLRRLVAPGFRGSGSNPSLADVARRASGGGTSASEDDTAGAAGHGHRRRNPTAAPSPLSAPERVAAAGTALAAATAGHREERVHRLRAVRHAADAWVPGDADGDGDAALIETAPNPLFRITSHVVATPAGDIEAAVAEVEAAGRSHELGALLKEMSVDDVTGGEARAVAGELENAGMLMRNMSIDERAAGAAEASDGEGEPCSPPAGHAAGSPPRGGVGGFGSDQEAVTPPTTGPNTDEAGTRDPSLSSLLEAGLSMQGVPAAAGAGAGVGAAGGALHNGDVLRAAFERQQALAEAKAAGRSPAAQ